jgi:hypothetical protein
VVDQRLIGAPQAEPATFAMPGVDVQLGLNHPDAAGITSEGEAGRLPAELQCRLVEGRADLEERCVMRPRSIGPMGAWFVLVPAGGRRWWSW